MNGLTQPCVVRVYGQILRIKPSVNYGLLAGLYDDEFNSEGPSLLLSYCPLVTQDIPFKSLCFSWLDTLAVTISQSGAHKLVESLIVCSWHNI